MSDKSSVSDVELENGGGSSTSDSSSSTGSSERSSELLSNKEDGSSSDSSYSMSSDSRMIELKNRELLKKMSKSQFSSEIAMKFHESSYRISRARSRKKKGKKPNKRTQEELKRELEMDDHLIPLEELYARYSTNPNKGLSDEKAQEILNEVGPNVLTPPEEESELIKFLREMTGGFSLLLLAGAVLCLVGYFMDTSSKDNLSLAIVLVVVVVLTAAFSYVQGRSSRKIMEGFKKLVPEFATVIRNGQETRIESKDIVPGDIIILKSGDRVPADVRLLQVDSFKVDNSGLTGETDPQNRTVNPTDDNPLETKNLAFYSTLVSQGRAKGLVISTGDNTVMGRITQLTLLTEDDPTPIHIEIDKFVKLITIVAVALGLAFFSYGAIVAGTDLITNLIFFIGIIVANVPEGLLSTVTVSLTLAAKRMSEKNVLIKHLESVETLGSVNTICSDKTGTLTRNVMTLVHIYYDSEVKTTDTSLSSGVYNPDDPTFAEVFDIITLCNNAKFLSGEQDKPISKRKTDGDASETALLKFAEQLEVVSRYRKKNPKLAEIPFNSANKYQVSIHHMEKKDEIKLVMKGAPERIIARCDKIMDKGKIRPLTDEDRKNFDRAYEMIGGRGERALGLASLVLPKDKYNEDYEFNTDEPNFPMENLVFVGLVAMIDPPRDQVPHAIKKCKNAGIKVIMVTGDHALTATSIAKQVGIIDEVPDHPERIPDYAAVVTGAELADMDDESIQRVLDHKQVVFARTSPQQKLIIVEACQKRGEIVGVTGDGVNDAPALKKADIGIAMGITGTMVAKEASNIILLDDNFASIINGVEEGRIIWDDLKKSIAYTLTSNIPEIVPYLMYIVFNIPLPLSTVLILCIDLGTDIVPAISLAYCGAEKNLMDRPPRNSKTDRLVTRSLIAFSYLQIGIIQGFGGMFTYFIIMLEYGIHPKELLYMSDSWWNESLILFGYTYEQRRIILRVAQSAYFISIIVVQWAGLLVCKTRYMSFFTVGLNNTVLNIGLITETLLGIFIVMTPFSNDILETEPITAFEWFAAFPFSILIFTYDEVRKYLVRKYPGGWVDRVTTY